jgi:soluble lytic murein transglycosylase-like protein
MTARFGLRTISRLLAVSMISIGTASAAPLPDISTATESTKAEATKANSSAVASTTSGMASQDASADPAKAPTTTPVQDAAKDIVGVKDETPMPVEPMLPATADAQSAPKSKTVVAPQPVPEVSHSELCSTLAASAERHNLPVALFANLIWQESRFRPQAVSPVGALGVAQFMPRVAEEVGLKNPFNPLEALPAAARFFSGLVERFGSLGLATAAYNAGSGRVGAWIAKRKGLPKETQHYVQTITGKPADHWRSASGKAAVFAMAKTLPCRQLATFAKYDQADMPEQRQVAEQRQAKVLSVALAKGSPALHKGRNIVVSVKASLASRGKSVVAKATVANAKATIIKVAGGKVTKAKSAKVKVVEASKRGKKSQAARGRSAGHHRDAGVKVASGR